MFNEYVDFEIRIRSAGADSYTVEARGPGGHASGVFKSPTADARYQALANRLERGQTDEKMLIELGQILFRAIFQDGVATVYAHTQGQLSADQGVRLRVDIDADDVAIAALPWEFLADPNLGPLAMLDAPIVRYLPQQSVVPKLKTTLPIKVLLSGAQPRGQQPIKVEYELNQVKAALDAHAQQGRVQILYEPHLTRSKFQQLLRQNIQVWHFAGHGESERDDEAGVLLFEDSEGDETSVSSVELGILLNRSTVRLIVLDACESGKLGLSPFRSVAPALVRAQIPAVIAMQFEVLDRVARAFAGEFYGALAEGFPIDACVTEGRKAIMGQVGLGQPDWGIPVVYTRAPDGKLFELPASSPAAPVDRQPVAPAASEAADDRAAQINALRSAIENKQRRLWHLQSQAARYGISTPPEIATEIEDLEGRRDYRGNLIREGEIAVLKRKLEQLGGA